MHHFQGKVSHRGHIEIGYTLAVWVILGGVFILYYISDGELAEMWNAWPWWAKALAVIASIIILVFGGLFENARQWPKTIDRDDNDE